ncbi:MAG: dihydroneopterin aldolase [Hyphomicrobiales bacterium]
MPPRRRRAEPKPSAAAPIAQDWIRLLGIQAYGHLGVTMKERDLGQKIEADVELAYDPVPSGRRPDALSACIDYEDVCRVVRAQIAMARCRLIETLAEELALALLAEFDPPRVRVRIRKLHIPVAEFSGVPEVVVERARS